MPITIRKPFQSSERVSIDTGSDTLVEQSHKDPCDINLIMKQYQRTGIINHLRDYGDSYESVDAITFHEAMNVVTNANMMFDALPSNLRKRFDNDPAQFLDFVNDEANYDEMVDLGLAQRRPVPAPDPDPAPDPVPDPVPDPSRGNSPEPAGTN